MRQEMGYILRREAQGVDCAAVAPGPAKSISFFTKR